MNKLKIKKNYDTQSIELSVIVENIEYPIFIGWIDLNELIEWFLKHEKEIREDELPIERLEEKSLAESIYYFYDSLDTDDDELIDKMYIYRSSHCLRFGCRGTDFPEIYIGKLKNTHEMSMFSPIKNWSYKIDINNFFLYLKTLRDPAFIGEIRC